MSRLEQAFCLALITACGLFAVVGSSSSCAHVEPLLVSGETLEGLGNSYVATTEAMNVACGPDGGASAETCTRWASFAWKFHEAYPPAVQLWVVAAHSSDTALQRQADVVVRQLAGELAGYADGGR